VETGLYLCENGGGSAQRSAVTLALLWKKVKLKETAVNVTENI